MKHYHFPIVIEQDEHGYFASCPSLQGCYTQGETYEEALANIKDAIKLHIEDRNSAKEDIRPAHLVSLSAVDITV
jgi:predicted RNase H-like HicB family nuclease